MFGVFVIDDSLLLFQVMDFDILFWFCKINGGLFKNDVFLLNYKFYVELYNFIE